MMTPKFEYTAISGFFSQDVAGSEQPDYRAITLPSLGLIDQSYETDKEFDPKNEKTPWERFACYVDHLNKKDSGQTFYKVIYLARHGLGYHNVKEAEVGRLEWEAHWARLEGDGNMFWADARLTDIGLEQAAAANVFWKDALTTTRIPAPQTYYSSPLMRCLETARRTFSTLDLPADQPYVPKVKELLRERNGVHTCDRRSSRTAIQQAFPEAVFEPNMSEEDQLWNPQLRETLEQHAERETRLLDDIFTNDSGLFLSFTVHSGTMQALHTATKKEGFRVAAGAIIPLFLKARRL